jgi:hypothetical protein
MSLLTGKCTDESLPTWEDRSDPLDEQLKPKEKYGIRF